MSTKRHIKRNGTAQKKHGKNNADAPAVFATINRIDRIPPDQIVSHVLRMPCPACGKAIVAPVSQDVASGLSQYRTIGIICNACGQRVMAARRMVELA
jgi:RNase P subunit RPR2